MAGITGEIEEVLSQRKIKSEAWIVDPFYHEGLKAEDDLCRLILQGRVKPVTHVVEGFENSTAQADPASAGSVRNAVTR